MSAETGRITYVGHATVLVEVAAVRLLTDPVLRHRVAHLRRYSRPPALDRLGDLDAVLISHAHADHLDLPSLRRVAAGVPVIAPASCADWLRRHGISRAIGVVAGDRVPVGDVEVAVTHAEHDGRRWTRGPARPAVGFVVDGPMRIYFAGDTDLFDAMAELAGTVDVALVPVAGWGPRIPAGHLDPRRAAWAISLLRPRIAVPIHWGTFASPFSRPADPAAPAREFEELVEAQVQGVEVEVLYPGAWLALPERER